MPESARKEHAATPKSDVPARCKTFTLTSDGKEVIYGINTAGDLERSSLTLRHQKGLRDTHHVLVKIDLKLTDAQARSFKHGGVRPHMYSGITSTARVITITKEHAIVRMQNGDVVDVFYPDGCVKRVQMMCGPRPIVVEYESLDSVHVRLKSAETRLNKSHSLSKQAPVYIDLVRLMRLQKEKVCVEKILEFFKERTITAKIESCLRTALEEINTALGFTFVPPRFQKVTKERVTASSRRENRQVGLFAVTQQTMAVTRASGQRVRTLRHVG